MRSMITGRYAIEEEPKMADAISAANSCARAGAERRRAVLAGCDKIVAERDGAERAGERGEPDARARSGCSPAATRWRRNSPRPTSRPCSAPTARSIRTTDDYQRHVASNFGTGSSRSTAWWSSPCAVARRSTRAAVAHPDHAPRLRRRLELHRRVDRRAAGAIVLRHGQAESRARYVRVPLRRPDGRHRQRRRRRDISTTKAST